MVYVTRCYKTRNGAGPLPHALPGKPWPTVEDATNVPHDYQGTVRFGWLDLDRVAALIDLELAELSSRSVKLVRSLAVTCLDQPQWPLPYVNHGRPALAAAEREFLEAIRARLQPASLFVSRGAAKEHVASI